MVSTSLGERRLQSGDDFRSRCWPASVCTIALASSALAAWPRNRRLQFVGIGEPPVANVETRGPLNNEILSSHGIQLARREGLGIQNVGLPDQGGGHGIAPRNLKAPP